MEHETAESGLADNGRQAVAGSGRFAKRWRVFAVVGVVILLVAVLLSLVLVRDGGSSGFDLTPGLASLVSEASEVCEADMPWEAGCVEAAWAACEQAKSFRRDFWRSAVPPAKIYDEADIMARSLPYEFLCRAAHMAELARLAAVLADRYGSEFYERSFWRFREHITYTPWEPSIIYGSVHTDGGDPNEPWPVLIGPSLGGSGRRFAPGRWLKKIQDWGFVGSINRKAIDGLSDQAVRVIDSLLGSVASLTEAYDSWPTDAPYDPEYSIKYQILEKATAPAMHDPTLVAYGNMYPSSPDLEVYEICSSATAKIRTTDWENRINDCRKAPVSQDCSIASFYNHFLVLRSSHNEKPSGKSLRRDGGRNPVREAHHVVDAHNQTCLFKRLSHSSLPSRSELLRRSLHIRNRRIHIPDGSPRPHPHKLLAHPAASREAVGCLLSHNPLRGRPAPAPQGTPTNPLRTSDSYGEAPSALPARRLRLSPSRLWLPEAEACRDLGRLAIPRIAVFLCSLITTLDTPNAQTPPNS